MRTAGSRKVTVLVWWVLTAAMVLALVALAGELEPALGTLRGLPVGLGALAVGLNALGPWLQSRAWRRFLPDGVEVPRGHLVETAGVMAVVANSVPLLLGGLATGTHLLATRGGIGHTRALAVAALDQLAEGVAKVVLVVLVLVWVPVPTALRSAGGLLLLAVAGLGGSLAWARRHGRPGDADRGPVSARIARWGAALDALADPPRLAAGIGLVLGIKLAEGLAVVAVATGLAPDLPLWGAPLALLAVNLATVVSVTPGNLGVFEGAAFAAWSLAGAAPPLALALALAQHGAFLVANLGGGWLMATFAKPAAR